MIGLSLGLSLGGRSPSPTPTPTPTGPVTAAAIEADGTVLSLTLSGVSAGSWAGYGFADGAVPMTGVTLATTTAGFDRTGGQAVANAARSRSLWAIKPCRKTPIAPSSTTVPNAKLLDEVDNGDGTRTVRLRLSAHVYAGDGCTLSLAAGWRSGASAQASVAVTNNSARAAAPVIGGRWLTVPKQRVTGSFRVDIMAGSINPEGRSGLAAVRFDVTDGTTTKSVWASAMTTSNAHGDAVRCWGADIDPSGLNAGLITVHKTLYPWVGPSRTSGTVQSTNAGSFVNTADAPLVMAYDPAGTRYAPAYVVCDPVNGTATASAAMVQSSLAAAKAVAAASKPVSVTCALQAIYLANRSAAAANGGAAISRMADNAIVVIPAGTTGMGATAITTGFTAAECWPIVMGDPEDANPRANCIVETGASAGNLRATHIALRDLTLNVGGVNLSNAAYYWLHNVQVEAKGGQGASSAFLTSSTTGYNYATKSAIGASLSAISWKQAGSGQKWALVRSCTTPRDINALAIVNCSAVNMAGWTAGGDADSQADWIAVGNLLLSQTARGITFPSVASGGYSQMVRPMFVNNVLERIGASTEPHMAMAENSLERFTHMLFEGNSLIGERTNTLYNDPGDLTSHNSHVDCRVAGNVFDWMPTKQDDFYDDTTVASNGGAPNYGYRPWLTDNLWFQDGCNSEGNVHARRTGGGGFAPHGYGRGAVVNPSAATGQGNAWTKFTADRSVLGDGTGGGDYRPASGSPLIGVASRANVDVDRAGVARGATFAAGALEAA